jgi:hypothetical protein
MSGKRKATLRFCEPCGIFHPTHRDARGEELCPALAQARVDALRRRFPGVPHVRTVPRTASR